MNELAVLHSRALDGMQAPEVNVEVHLANGLPSLTVVGLPDAEVREAKDRVRAAIQHAGLEMPRRRITINLTPADLPKGSGRYDLPMALGILAASGQIRAEGLARYEFAGELSLSGQLRPVQGVLAMALAIAQQGANARAFVLPRANADEAALARSVRIYPADSLLDVCAHFGRQRDGPRLQLHQAAPAGAAVHYPDMADVRGLAVPKRALEIAAAGEHSVLMIGPPGAGKTMLALRFPGLLPPMSEGEALEAATLCSLDRPFRPQDWMRRPFRTPHHSASGPALVGGTGQSRPGEITLAHRGVLFLDELPEFPRHVLEVLREPLESGRITISRAARQAEYPARFQLLAAMNPCPCGYLGHAVHVCRCTPDQIGRYQRRISGPFLDRIDLQVAVSPVEPEILATPAPAESSAEIAARVARARARQQARQGCANQALSVHDTEQFCRPDAAGMAMLQQAMVSHRWSARAYHRLLRVARTIADLEDCESIRRQDVSSALQYRGVLPED